MKYEYTIRFYRERINALEGYVFEAQIGGNGSLEPNVVTMRRTNEQNGREPNAVVLGGSQSDPFEVELVELPLLKTSRFVEEDGIHLQTIGGSMRMLEATVRNDVLVLRTHHHWTIDYINVYVDINDWLVGIPRDRKYLPFYVHRGGDHVETIEARDKGESFSLR